MAEAHPVGFQWVVEAKRRGARIVHIDPRFTRTSALAHEFMSVRAGTDIALLGGLINYVLTHERDFRDYVTAYTNAGAILREEFADTEDLDGLFSGFDPDTGSYDVASWAYENVPDVSPAVGKERWVEPTNRGPSVGGRRDDEAATVEQFGSGGATVGGKPKVDPTLQHPRCVYQVLKRHFARYTPAAVAEICGVDIEQFLDVARAITENSGRERTTAWVYSVGWTQHTVGAQNIRSASILQLLLGNIGRPGGGILALRGHASIQGSTDVPTLFNLLPGYLPMPDAHRHPDIDSYVRADEGRIGFWGNIRAYAVSLLKAYWGDHATAANDFRYDHLPRLTGDHGTYQTVRDQLAGRGKGYFLAGENPAVGSANGKLQRLGMANLEWLVVRDMRLIESATFWKDGPEIDTGELDTERIGTEVFFLPAASHAEKDGTFTNTQRLLQWHEKAVEPPEEARSDLWFYYHLGRIIREKLADSTDPRDLPVQELTWSYPTEGPHAEPSAQAVLAEMSGFGPDGPLSGYPQLRADGSTSSGCWIYCGVYADGHNQAANRQPYSEQSWVAPGWAWAWPDNRRILYNRASADPQGRPWSERKRYLWWDEEQRRWAGPDRPDFEAEKPPDFQPEPNATAQDGLAGDEPFIMQADGKGWLFAPAGLLDGPLPTHYEPVESPVPNSLYGQQENPIFRPYQHAGNRYHPIDSDVYPYVFTTYRLTEHHTAGGMSRMLPYLSELQPEFFCEVSPALARERGLRHLGWATIVSARSAIEARVMVTDRIRPLRVRGRVVHQVGLPYHWGTNGLSIGDAANDLLPIALEPNVDIQESKAATCDIRPGRRPRGRALPELVRTYRRRAGIERSDS
ncbi:formate dehydrogenase major subunit [Tamaricihabitans halophyticus]|uniref:Formate dehydrogenase major subunit n=3 Tax=Tamaricihabitans halophyticus TaxID=1262583 RepID=A0A4R2Q7F1_9PSEU|nr:formate dehydrogenase major subunit [Tamaricihabitans halophyticus]